MFSAELPVRTYLASDAIRARFSNGWMPVLFPQKQEILQRRHVIACECPRYGRADGISAVGGGADDGGNTH
jgi:hypothetical protein